MAGVGRWQEAASALDVERVGLVRKLGHNIDLGQRRGWGGRADFLWWRLAAARKLHCS